MEIKTIPLKTPIDIQYRESESLANVGVFITAQFYSKDGWTEECSKKMCDNPLLLFLYDQMEFFLGNAMGTHELKVVFNPMMIQYLHPQCTKKGAKPVKLKKLFDISPFLHHLKDHFDNIGDAMQARFEAVHKDKFLSTEELDKIAPSPYSLVHQKILLEDKTVEYMKSLSIESLRKTTFATEKIS